MKWYSLKEIFSIDFRSLALFRVAIAVLTILDSLNRLTVAEAHYSDAGVMPRMTFLSEMANSSDFSIHMMNGHWTFQAFLILLQVVFSFLVLIGYRPRVFAFFTWVLLASLHTRIPINTYGGDDVIRLLWFWSIFLPLGARYSVESALDTTPREARAKAVSGFAAAGILMQMPYIYFFSFIQKLHPIWHTEFSALYYALNVDHLVSAPGQWLLKFPGFLKFMTAATMVLESVGCFLAFSPLWLPQLRLAMALSFIAFHFGLFMGMYLGIFPWICAFGWFLFFPGEFWDFVERKLVPRVPRSIVLYYDRNCGFCRIFSKLFREFLLLQGLEVVEAQSVPEIEREMRKNHSWVLSDGGEKLAGFAVFQRMVRLSPVFRPLAPLVALPPVRLIGDQVYRLISHNRMRFSFITTRLREMPRDFAVGRTEHLTAAFFIFLVTWWNLQTVKWPGPDVPRPLSTLMMATYNSQKWNLFAPYPFKDDGWFVIDGKQINGERVNLLQPELPVSYEKPELVAATYKNSAWRKYHMSLWFEDNEQYLLYFGKYLCRIHNRDHEDDQRLETITITYMLELTPTPGEPLAPIERETLWEHTCFQSQSGL